MSSCYATTLRLMARRASSAVANRTATRPALAGSSSSSSILAATGPSSSGGSYCWMSSSRKNKNKRTNKAIHGSRGSRGHGWYVKYREGRGGRHLQGEYWDRQEHHWDMQQWNDAVFSLGSQFVYLDIAVEPPAAAATVTSAAAGAQEESTSSSSSSPNQRKEAETVKPLSTERLIIQVASTVMPETCINFIGLCQEAAYKGTILYRIEKEVGICGGDVLTNTGKTGQCLQDWPAYDDSSSPSSSASSERSPSSLSPDMNPLRHNLPPPDEEPMALWHTAGTVTMLCAKVNEIDSRFILCGRASPHLDGIHRAFGKLEPESLKLVQDWQDTVLTSYGKPKSVTLRIVDCGVLENYKTSDANATATKEQGGMASTA